MKRPVAVGAVVLLVVGAGTALAFGVGPMGSLLGSDQAGDGTHSATPTPTPKSDTTGGDGGGSGGGGGDGSADGDQASTERPDYKFRFVTESIEKCGTTCRDVTVRVLNHGTKTAKDVTFVTTISTGDKQVWQGSETFAQIGAGGEKTRTKRVKLGYLDAAKVKNNGGYITIETTVTWDGGEQTFSERRKVA